MAPSLTRRDLLAALSLAAVAGPLLAACGNDPARGGSGGPGGAGELTLVSSQEDRAAPDAAAIPATVAALQRFSGGLYGRLAAEPGNLALSPYSVAIALGMTLNGAVGATADEMRDALALHAFDTDGLDTDELDTDGLDTDGLNAGLNALEQLLEGMAGTVERADRSKAAIELAVASALFGERTTTWQQPFLDTLAREYGAGVQAVDFVHAAEEARTQINGWTAEQTHDRIPELIPDGVLDELTRLVLVNALYLKAPWEWPFAKELTEPGDFHRADGSVLSVDMMRTSDAMPRISVGDGWRSVRLPYAGSALAMTVVLPDDGRLDDVEALLAGQGVAPLLVQQQDGALADLRLPRWTFRTPSPLKDALIALGMPTAFDPGGADFSGMTSEADLFISAVLHEVFIAVDEDGTEAAAATAVVMSETSAPLTEPFVVDRPFLFVVHDTEHSAPLFVGRVADPSA